MSQRKFFITLVTLVTLSFFIPNHASATHSANMEMFYRHTTDSSYEFTLIFYRNCVGFTAGAPFQVSISAAAQSKGLTSSIQCSRLPVTGSGVPPLQPPNLYNCLDTALCAEEYVYRGTWTSPGRATDWIFSYQLCCLPSTQAPANVQNGTLYVEAGLDNLTFPDSDHKNLSPIFHNRRPNHPGRTTDTINNPPIISVCQSRNVLINETVTEYDGDSVAYEFFHPQTNGGTNTTYINGYSFSSPIPSQSGPVVIDSITGRFSFIPGVPIASGIYFLGVKATEYRNDTVVSGGSFVVIKKPIGFVKRNLWVIIEDSANCNDGNMEFINESTGNPIDSLVLECPFDSVDVKLSDFFWCNSVDTNASFVQIRHIASGVNLPLKSAKSLDCDADLLSKRIRIYLDTNIQADTFELVFKRGTDGNTILSECFLEMPAYQDTLTLIFQDQPTGAFTGDYIFGQGKWANDEVCGDTTFTLYMTHEFTCNSVSVDASDLEIIDPFGVGHVITDWNVNCSNGRADSIQLTVSPGLLPGTSKVRLVRGSDSNSLLNVCGEEWPADSMYIVVDEIKPDIGLDTVVCEEDSNWSFYISAGAYYAYSWSTGETTPNILITDTGTYSVVVFNEFFCPGADTMVVTSKKCYSGINDQSSIENFDVYPNPGNGLFVVRASGLSGQEVAEVYNSSGKLVRSIDDIEKDGFTFDLRKESGGLYFLKIVLEGEVLFSEQIVLTK